MRVASANRGMPTRSSESAVRTMSQPLPSSPSIAVAGTVTSSKNTS
jgi:hypothetical protein